MASEKQETNESQIGLTLSRKRRDHKITNENYLPSSDEIIVIDDDSDNEITLEPKNKKPRLGSWWDNVEPYNELSLVVKGLPKAKENYDVALKADSYFAWTDPDEYLKKKDDERSQSEKKDENKGYGHVTLEDLGVSLEDLKSIPWEAFDPIWEIRPVAYEPRLSVGGYIFDSLSPY